MWGRALTEKPGEEILHFSVKLRTYIRRRKLETGAGGKLQSRKGNNPD